MGGALNLGVGAGWGDLLEIKLWSYMEVRSEAIAKRGWVYPGGNEKTLKFFNPGSAISSFACWQHPLATVKRMILMVRN